MTFRPTLIERAYELAASGDCRTVADIKQQLQEEGFTGLQSSLYGPSLLADLRRLCQKHYRNAPAG